MTEQRNTWGGKREGAGSKPDPPEKRAQHKTRRLMLYLSEELAAYIDRERGTQSRNAYIRERIQPK